VLIVAGLSAAMAVPVARWMGYIVIKITVPQIPKDNNKMDNNSEDNNNKDNSESTDEWGMMGAEPNTTRKEATLLQAESLPQIINWFNSISIINSPTKIVPIADGSTLNDQSTPTNIRSRGSFSFRDEIVNPFAGMNINRIRCIGFINSQPLEVELEGFQRKLKGYADSLTFLANLKGRADLMRKSFILFFPLITCLYC
jgi:hypothetical protein